MQIKSKQTSLISYRDNIINGLYTVRQYFFGHLPKLVIFTVRKGKYSKRIFLNMDMHTLSIQGNSMGIQVPVMPRHSRITLYESSQFFRIRTVYS